MSKRPRASHFTSLLHRSFSKSPSPIKPCRFSNSQPHLQYLPNPHRHRNLSIRAFVSSSETKKDEKEKEFKSSTGFAKSEGENGSARSSDEEYPSGEFEFKEFGAWKKFTVKLRMLVAFPWEGIPNGTVLTMKLRGQFKHHSLERIGIKNCFAGVLEKVGIDLQAQKVGKYKSVGDQLTRKNMSEETCEMLTSLLDNIYGKWLDNISLTKE